MRQQEDKLLFAVRKEANDAMGMGGLSSLHSNLLTQLQAVAVSRVPEGKEGGGPGEATL